VAEADERTASAAVPPPPPLDAWSAVVESALAAVVEDELAGLSPTSSDPVRHAVLSPGKRMRPLLVMAAHDACGGRGPEAATLACAVELVHAYSLVHDDLPCMDDDVLRRGQPSLHVRFDVPTAIYAGSALMPLAVRVVDRGSDELGLGRERREELVRTLTVAAGAGGMVGGQLRDLRAEGRAVTREELEEIHHGKTAALMAASTRLGAVSAGGRNETVERLTRFGRTLGLAFQAVDDILDVTGSVRQLGKTSGRDADLRKATYPSVLGLEASRKVSRELAASARAELEGLEEIEALEAIVTWVVDRER
jgi:geranylgeranyl pyrophosphate synthase